MKFANSVKGDLQRLDAEAWLIGRMEEHGVRVEDGVTSWDIRRDRIRAAIITFGLSEVIIGRSKDQKSETYRQAFERFYDEPLDGEGTSSAA